MPKLSREFYNQPTLKVAKLLLGKFLIRKIGDKKLIGKIVETEAYCGPKDLASHASRGKTPRTEVMFGPPGHAYIYLIYGINYCFNIVTEKNGYPAAVLIRALEPVEGIEKMARNRKLTFHFSPLTLNLSNGPGKLCQALQIDKTLNKIDLTGDILWVEDRGEKINPHTFPSGIKPGKQDTWEGVGVKPQNIIAAKRIGVNYAKKYKDKLWRFYLADNNFVSKK